MLAGCPGDGENYERKLNPCRILEEFDGLRRGIQFYAEPRDSRRRFIVAHSPSSIHPAEASYQFPRATPYMPRGGQPSRLPPPPTLDIPFTFCPGLPLVASGQFEHLSPRVIYRPARNSARSRPSFTHVHRFTTRARHDGDGAPRVTVPRACTRAAARTPGTHVHSHTRTASRDVPRARPVYHGVSREPLFRDAPRLSERPAISSHLENASE